MLSVILPTYNEAENVAAIMPMVAQALRDVPHEIIIVDDDSPDGTAEVARRMAEQYPGVRVLQRSGRRGLSSAVMEGFAMAEGEYLAVMDSDGQHDPRTLLDMHRALQAGAHIVVASRYVKGGSVEGWSGFRPQLSKMATMLARRLPYVRVTDPMSGYFAIRRTAYRPVADRLHPRGFKILLEVLAHLPRGTRAVEVPLVFGTRWSGHSKLSMRVQMEFMTQLLGIAMRRVRNFLWEAQWVVLFLVFAVVLALLLPRVFAMHRLFFSSQTRAVAVSALRTVADREGWLLSDMEVTDVNERSLQILHRPHTRGAPSSTCAIIRFEDAVLIPCSA